MARIPVKTIKGNVSILYRRDYDVNSECEVGGVEITIRDHEASEVIAVIQLSAAEYCRAAMGNLVDMKCDVSVGQLERVGKKMVMLDLDFPVGDVSIMKRKDAAEALLDSFTPNGWIADRSFSSQNSFFTKEDTSEWAHTIIRSWV